MKRIYTAAIGSERCQAHAPTTVKREGAQCMRRQVFNGLCRQHFHKAPHEIKARMMNGADYSDALYAYRKYGAQPDRRDFMSKHTPATPLPWTHGCPTSKENYILAGGHTVIAILPMQSEGSEYVVDDERERRALAAYIVRAANAYPKLVGALHYVMVDADVGPCNSRILLSRLLRSLGEEA